MGRAMKILSQETKNNIIFETVFNVQIISWNSVDIILVKLQLLFYAVYKFGRQKWFTELLIHPYTAICKSLTKLSTSVFGLSDSQE
jgi:hypothetical protein